MMQRNWSFKVTAYEYDDTSILPCDSLRQVAISGPIILYCSLENLESVKHWPTKVCGCKKSIQSQMGVMKSCLWARSPLWGQVCLMLLWCSAFQTSLKAWIEENIFLHGLKFIHNCRRSSEYSNEIYNHKALEVSLLGTVMLLHWHLHFDMIGTENVSTLYLRSKHIGVYLISEGPTSKQMLGLADMKSGTVSQLFWGKTKQALQHRRIGSTMPVPIWSR